MEGELPALMITAEVQEVVRQTSVVLERALDHVADFPLHASLRLTGQEAKASPRGIEELWYGTSKTLPSEMLDHAWAIAYKWRCILTFTIRTASLVWLEDKVAQRKLMQRWPVGSAEPLPSRWFKSSEIQAAEEEAARLVQVGEQFVVKPRHAASGQGLAVFRPPCDIEMVSAAIREAGVLDCKPGESWQLYQVPHGIGLESLYPSLGFSTRQPDRPLELKVQVLWGHVIGAGLHTSQLLWILPSGRLHRWNKRDNHHRAMIKAYGALPSHAEALLEPLLRDHWAFLVKESEAIAHRWGLDEVRVDWFMGCPSFGPRISEVTWMGSADRIPRVLQGLVAEAFFAGHRQRIKLEEQGAVLPSISDLPHLADEED